MNKGGRVFANTIGEGNAGSVNITALGDISADGETEDGFNSGIASLVGTDGVGDSGGVTISTNNLNLTAGGRVDASTLGEGNAGVVEITASGDISADGEGSDGFQSGILSLVGTDGVGDSGGVTISTNNLNLTAGGRVTSNTFGLGNAGAIEITASGDISADGERSDGFPSD